MPKDTKKSTREPGRGRGNLERDCFAVVSDVLAGKTELPENKKLTPHAVGRIIKEQDGLDTAPSTGAVAANFARWAELGVVNLGEKPVHIKGWTANFKKAGADLDALDAVKAKRRERAAAERAKARAAAAESNEAPAKAKKAPAKKAAAKKAKATT